MGAGPRGPGKPQRERPRDMSLNPQNRSSIPATPTSSHGYQSGTSTPEMTSGQTPSSPMDGGRIIPGEVRDYMRTRWQKFYDDAVAEEKTMSARIVILGQSSVTLPVQQGWNTVGGKSATKGGTPWGPPNRHLTSRGVPFLQALKAAVDEQGNKQKGG